VPFTEIFSMTDGFLHWTTCMGPEGNEWSENIRVPGSHTGMTHNPLVFSVIAHRLAQPEGKLAPFESTGLHKIIDMTLTPLKHVI
jgi:hypothetical protein